MFVKAHMIRMTDRAFDNFAGAAAEHAAKRRMPGLAREDGAGLCPRPPDIFEIQNEER